jgi:hypothetical protein
MSFAFPLALIGLGALPVLVAIYWLRNRSRPRVVSSLILWMDHRQLKEGGRLIDRFQTPLLFFLELLAILLIVIAAAGPMVRAGTSAGPLVIVLDDSFSMLAGGDDSARHRGEDAVRSELRSLGSATARLILAGERPQILGETTGDSRQDKKLLDRWQCFSPDANLGEAVTFAFAVGGERSRVLVITDHSPTELQETAKLEWRSFGRRRNNIAFVNATRTTRDGKDRCLFEIANLSDSSARTELVLEAASGPDRDRFAELRRYQLELAANGSQRIVVTLDERAGPVKATIQADSLTIDNRVILLPSLEPSVRVENSVANESLRGLVESAVRSCTAAEVGRPDPQLIFTDDPNRAATSRAWVIRITSDTDAASYIGPFVVDRNHPLAEGLSLQGVIWGAGKSTPAGLLIITAGDIPLVSELRRADQARELKICFRPDLSTLQRTPAWPVLIWNLLSWRASELPGISQSNVRMGTDVNIRVEDATEVDVTTPAGEVRHIPAVDNRATFVSDAPGVYRINAGEARYSFSSNALRKEESDLKECSSGSWGSLDDPSAAERELRNIAWVFLLILFLVLLVHLSLVYRATAPATVES